MLYALPDSTQAQQPQTNVSLSAHFSDLGLATSLVITH